MVDLCQSISIRSPLGLHLRFMLAFVTALIITVPTSASADAPPASEQCHFNDNEIKVNIALRRPLVRAGEVSSVDYVVSGVNASVNQLAIVIEFPADSRFVGSGFIAMIPRSKGPLGINLSADRTSAIVPFFWKGAALSGSVGWIPLKAGQTQLRWRLVATRPCAPHDVQSYVLPAIVVWPGKARVVQHDLFSQGSSLGKVRNPQATRDIIVEKGRYQIVSANTGQVVFEGPGVDPSFTTSGRFVTSSRFDDQKSGTFIQNLDNERQIVDAISGEIIWFGPARYIAFAQNDSLVILGNALGEKFFLMSTIISAERADIDGSDLDDYQGQVTVDMRKILSCSTHDNKEDDTNRVFALDFDSGVATFSLTSGEDINNDGKNFEKLFKVSLLSSGVDMSRSSEERNEVLTRGIATKLIKTTDARSKESSDPKSTTDKSMPNWSIEQPIVLEQNSWDDDQLRPLIGTILPLTSNALTTDVRRTKTTSAAYSSNYEVDPAETFDTLESVGLRFSTPVQVERFRMPSIANDSKAAVLAGTAARVAILSHKFGLAAPDIQALFPKKGAGSWGTLYCNADEYGNDDAPSAMGLRHLDLAVNITAAAGRYFLLEFSCFTGSGFAAGGRSLLRKLFLFQRTRGKVREYDLESTLGSDSSVLSGAERQAASAKFDVIGAGGNTVILSSAGAIEPVLLDLQLSKVVGGNISLSHPELLQAARLSVDENALIQDNRDGLIYVYDLQSGNTLLSGLVVNGEAVLATPEGYFDSTFEGAYNVRVRFEGLDDDYSFAQFADVLRVRGLVPLVLSRISGLSPPKIIGPPIVSASIDGKNAADLLHPRSVRIHATVRSEAAKLHSMAIFVDGRLRQSNLIQGSTTERDYAVDANAGSVITLVAADEGGLRSLPTSILVPGKRRPTGKLHVLTVGVNVYEDSRLPSLQSAADDAQKVARVLAGERGKRFASVEVKALLNGAATQEAILVTLERMVQTSADDDAIVLFVASHGLEVRSGMEGTDSAEMYIALSRTVFDSTPKSALSWSRLAQALAASKVPVIVFLDACHGGLVDQEVGTANDSAASRLMTVRGAPIAVFAASKRRQVSRALHGTGLFTRAIVDALETSAANSVSVSSLYRSVRSKVDRQTNGRQTPWLIRNEAVGDLLLF